MEIKESNITKSKTDLNITGSAGEYFVAGEIAKRGAIATLTIKNTPNIDILGSSTHSNKFAKIQVKTRSINNKQGWILTKKVEKKLGIENLFYVFVNLKKENEANDYYIIPYDEFAEHISRLYKEWIVTPGKKGKPHRDNPVRCFVPDKKNGVDYDLGQKYKDRWDILGIF